jgi:hypothetical protein
VAPDPQASYTIHVVRKDARSRQPQLGWTVALARLGRGGGVRYFAAVSLHSDGSYNPRLNRTQLREGMISGLAYTRHHTRNMSVALLACAAQLRQSADRDEMEGLADVLRFVSRESRRLLRRAQRM